MSPSTALASQRRRAKLAPAGTDGVPLEPVRILPSCAPAYDVASCALAEPAVKLTLEPQRAPAPTTCPSGPSRAARRRGWRSWSGARASTSRGRVRPPRPPRSRNPSEEEGPTTTSRQQITRAAPVRRRARIPRRRGGRRGWRRASGRRRNRTFRRRVTGSATSSSEEL